MQIADYIKKILSRIEHKPIFIEIGAAHGDSTRWLVESLKKQNLFNYFAFEPDERSAIKFDEMKDSLNFKRLNLFDPLCENQVYLFHAAVGDKTGKATFYPSSGQNPTSGPGSHVLSSSLKKPVEHLNYYPWCKFDTQIEVNVVSLDDFCAFYKLNYIDFIWIDSQGAEDLIIKGGTNALKHTQYVYTEYYDNQMYENQMNLKQIQKSLPGEWKIIHKWEADALLQNTQFDIGN